MSKRPDVLRTYEIELHGQPVTVTRYEYVPPKPKKVRPTFKLAALQAAGSIWEQTATEAAAAVSRNETDYARIRALEPLDGRIDWDKEPN